MADQIVKLTDKQVEDLQRVCPGLRDSEIGDKINEIIDILNDLLAG